MRPEEEKVDSTVRGPHAEQDEAETLIADDEPDMTLLSERWEVLERIGEGGMSVVYKARHRVMQRSAAVKFMHKHLAYGQNYQRFQREAQAAGTIDHPNVVGVLDCGVTAQGQPFLIMDFVEGTSLSDAIRAEGEIDLKTAIPIFVQICEGLNAAHSKGIIHRDLKPSNVMLLVNEGTHNFVKIVDFGIAKLIPQGEDDPRSSHQLTRTGEVFGSPLYMSPEQCTGSQLDARSDIYSMGCLMYETLCGDTPFLGGSYMETMFKQLNEMPPPLHPKKSGNSSASFRLVEQVILKALAKDPGDRYQSMEELKNDLLAAGSGWKAWWRTRALHDATSRWQKSKKRQIGVIKIVAVALVLLLPLVLYCSHLWLDVQNLEQKARQVVLWPPYVYEEPPLNLNVQTLKLNEILYEDARRGFERHDDQSEENLCQVLCQRASGEIDAGRYREAVSDLNQALSHFSAVPKVAPEDKYNVQSCQWLLARAVYRLDPHDIANAQNACNILMRFPSAHIEDWIGPFFSVIDDELKQGQAEKALERLSVLQEKMTETGCNDVHNVHFQDWVRATLLEGDVLRQTARPSLAPEEFAKRFADFKTGLATIKQQSHNRERDKKQFRRNYKVTTPGGEEFVIAMKNYADVSEQCEKAPANNIENLTKCYYGWARLLLKYDLSDSLSAKYELKMAPDRAFQKALEYARQLPEPRRQDMLALIGRDYANWIGHDSGAAAWQLRLGLAQEIAK